MFFILWLCNFPFSRKIFWTLPLEKLASITQLSVQSHSFLTLPSKLFPKFLTSLHFGWGTCNVEITLSVKVIGSFLSKVTIGLVEFSQMFQKYSKDDCDQIFGFFESRVLKYQCRFYIGFSTQNAFLSNGRNDAISPWHKKFFWLMCQNLLTASVTIYL